MLPKTVYGAEVTYASDEYLRLAGIAIFSVVKAKCNLTANAALVFREIATKRSELEPERKIAHHKLGAL
eukprot:8447044-Lingulodinium_polyedra.AAC.1